jgi:hypothetical protein
MPSRKSIMSALLAKLAPPGGAFPTSGRRLRDPEHVADLVKPALFLIKPNERYDRSSSNTLPPKRIMETYAVIYTDIGNDGDAVPADVIDDLLDIVDAALAPAPADQMRGGGQTLGGLVVNVVIDGSLDIAPGDVQGKGTVVIPINITLLPDRSAS